MPNDSISARAICPYYRRISRNGHELVCDGIAHDAETAMIFHSRASMEKWVELRCGTYDYMACPIARSIGELQR